MSGTTVSFTPLTVRVFAYCVLFLKSIRENLLTAYQREYLGLEEEVRFRNDEILNMLLFNGQMHGILSTVTRPNNTERIILIQLAIFSFAITVAGFDILRGLKVPVVEIRWWYHIVQWTMTLFMVGSQVNLLILLIYSSISPIEMLEYDVVIPAVSVVLIIYQNLRLYFSLREGGLADLNNT